MHEDHAALFAGGDMDFKQIIGKPIKLKLKTGQILNGFVQNPPDKSLFQRAVPLLTFEKMQQARECFGNQIHQTELRGEDVTKYIDFIDISLIESFEIIESTIKNFHLVTEGGKKINFAEFQMIATVPVRPGWLKIEYKLPWSSKFFDLGELEIRDGVIQVPVTMAFISYAREDKDKVKSISMTLNDYGILTWHDDKMLLPGDDWQHRIEQAIEEADYFLLFLSSQTIDRVGYKNRELNLALYQQSLRPAGKRFIIPILLDECQPPHNLSSPDFS